MGFFIQTPEQVKLRRGPDEMLRRRVEELSERFINTILVGSSLTVALLGTPGLVLKVFPNADPLLHFGSGLVLFLAGAIAKIRRSAKILEKRATARLALIGKRLVADSLDLCLGRGCRVFHGIPVCALFETLCCDVEE